jgi:selenocysteine lyase/cysteine desulfurase
MDGEVEFKILEKMLALKNLLIAPRTPPPPNRRWANISILLSHRQCKNVKSDLKDKKVIFSAAPSCALPA